MAKLTNEDMQEMVVAALTVAGREITRDELLAAIPAEHQAVVLKYIQSFHKNGAISIRVKSPTTGAKPVSHYSLPPTPASEA